MAFGMPGKPQSKPYDQVLAKSSANAIGSLVIQEHGELARPSSLESPWHEQRAFDGIIARNSMMGHRLLEWALGKPASRQARARCCRRLEFS